MSNDLPPNGTPAAPTTRHTYSASRSDLRTLRLRLRSFAADSHATPVFVDGAAIEGKVELELSKRLKASSIVLTVRGFERRSSPRAVYMNVNETSNANDQTFLEQSVILWSATTASAPCLEAGSHAFPFRETLPQTLSTSQGLIPLPSTFSPDNCPIFILYEITVVLRRGLLHRDETLLTPFRFVRRTQAPAPGPQRRIAYDTGSALPGPHLNPSGWNTRTVILQGQVLGRAVEVHCQFSVAAPAVFPRGGSPIPIWVHLRTRDRQALETITSAGHLQVSLDRVLSWATTTTNASARSESADEPRTVAPARLWPVSGGPTEPATDMHFQGEVMPPGNLTPSFMAPSFQLGYILSFSVQVTGLYVHGAKRGDPALTLPITLSR